MKIYLFSKSKKTLRLISEEIKGDIQLKTFKLYSPSVRNPLPSKKVIKLLKNNKVFLSKDIITRSSLAEKILKQKGIEYENIDLCPVCLLKDRITKSFGLCEKCLEKELTENLNLSKEFNFLKFDRKGFYYDEIKPKYIETELTIDDLKINKNFKEILRKRGIKKLFPIQELAVTNGLLEGENLLIVSATATGKTLIAELAGVEKALKNKKMLFAVPLVALANQKYREFKVYEKLGLKVAIRVGISRVKEEEGLEIFDEDYDYENADIIIGTYEGIDGLIRKKKLNNVGIAVIDEVHNIGDEERGAEVLGLIKRIRFLFPEAQIIGLSATIKNAKEIADLLGMKLLDYDDRPIPLKRYVIFTRNKLKEIKELVLKEFKKVSRFGYRGQSIVFTNSRRNAQRLASYLNQFVPTKAYHAGMPYIKRKSIETEFLHQKIACIVTTAALAAGVDFPASQVIFESLYMGNKPLSINEFNQMIGRAGRPLYHDRGKAIVVIETDILRGEESLASKLLKEKANEISMEFDEESILEQEMVNYFTGLRIDEFAKKKLENLDLLGNIGKIAVEHFLKPSEAIFINENLDLEPVELAIRLEPFENAYLSQKLKQELEESYRTRVSSRYFDGVGILFEEPLKKYEKFVNTIVHEFLFCNCKEFPYCEHGAIELSKKLVSLRLEGKRIDEIPKHFKKYEMLIYSGDIFDWFDSLIRKLEAIEAFGIKTEKIRRKLENPKVEKENLRG